MGIKKYLEDSGEPGTVIYFGCPAEEGGSGKTFMAREGVFNGLDFALSWHPSSFNMVWPVTTLANCQVYYRFKGLSAHAAANPEQGRSALDAAELMNVGVQFLREHMIPDARVHYALTKTGGFSPNVVQSEAEVLYLIRAPKQKQVEELRKRVDKIAKGAAMMTETEVEIDFTKACSNIVLNSTLCKVLQDNMESTPMPAYTDDEMAMMAAIHESTGVKGSMARSILNGGSSKEEMERATQLANRQVLDFVMPLQLRDIVGPGSTDVGDVSWMCPTAQIMTTTRANETPSHSWQVVTQSLHIEAVRRDNECRLHGIRCAGQST